MTPLGINRHWRSLRIKGRPTKMPDIPDGHHIICRVRYRDKNKKECAVVCDSLRKMQTLYDRHVENATISWHHTGVFVVPLRSM